MDIQSDTLGGIPVHLLNLLDAPKHEVIYAVFFLHGRLQTAESIFPLCKKLLASHYQMQIDKGLLCIVVEQRNHNSRMVDHKRNLDHVENPRHAVDMFSIVDGTSDDVTFLLDYSKLLLGNVKVQRWGIAGVSLGGHVAIQALCKDKRLEWGCSFIGCGDYMALMKRRFAGDCTKEGDGQWRDLELLVQSRGAMNFTNGLSKKSLLIVNGGIDELVPPVCNSAFIEKSLDSGCRLKVVVDELAGHRVSKLMVEQFLKFYEAFLVAEADSKAF